MEGEMRKTEGGIGDILVRAHGGKFVQKQQDLGYKGKGCYGGGKEWEGNEGVRGEWRSERKVWKVGSGGVNQWRLQ